MNNRPAYWPLSRRRARPATEGADLVAAGPPCVADSRSDRSASAPPGNLGTLAGTLAGIDLNEDEQLTLLDALAPYLRDFPDFLAADVPTSRRYTWPNAWFSKADAVILYALIRHLQPARHAWRWGGLRGERHPGYQPAPLRGPHRLRLRRAVSTQAPRDAA